MDFVVAGCLVTIFLFVSGYNALLSLHDRSDSLFVAMHDELKQRQTAAASLAAAVLQYCGSEAQSAEELLTAVQTAADAGEKSLNEMARDESALTAALNKMCAEYVVIEENEQFAALRQQLALIQEELVVKQKRYNQIVDEYNAKQKSFPCNLVVKLVGFIPYERVE